MASRPTEIGTRSSIAEAKGIPITLIRAQGVIGDVLRPILDEAGVTEQQVRVLRSLFGVDSLETNEIAHHTLLLPPSVSRILQSLEERGFIDRHLADYDHRITRVSLSESGSELVETFSTQWEARYERIVRRFGVVRYERLLALLLDFAALDVDEICDSSDVDITENASRDRSTTGA